MKNFENYFKKEKWTKALLVLGILFLIPFFSNAGSIRDVSRNIERVESIKAPFLFVMVGDSRDGEREDLHRLFLRDKVRAVFEADDHRYDRGLEDGILYLISGGGGAPLSAVKERGIFPLCLDFHAEGEDREGR
jgi:hypothetical protein